MKIAIFAETYYPFISGVVTHIETLKNGLEAQGHQVLLSLIHIWATWSAPYLRTT